MGEKDAAMRDYFQGQYSSARPAHPSIHPLFDGKRANSYRFMGIICAPWFSGVRSTLAPASWNMCINVKSANKG